ncbi:MAG TPA: short chain dehydrogenase, partial [Marinobacter hydrocarbonoclasticus]|nr:short chain dehydrogenase [Marinobacter nauticus]
MSDLYLKLVNTPVGKTAAQSLGLPSPAPLKRLKRVDQPFIEGDVLIGAGNGARAIATLGSIVGASPATLHHATGPETLAESAKASPKARALEITGDVSGKFS